MDSFGDMNLFFTDANCLSAPWMDHHSWFGGRNFGGTALFYPDLTASVTQITVQSLLDGDTGVCVPFSDTIDLVPALQFPIAFTTPFHLEPEPCFTPPEPTPEQFIHGCIKTNGTLKIVNDPADCSDRETPISWLGE